MQIFLQKILIVSHFLENQTKKSTHLGVLRLIKHAFDLLKDNLFSVLDIYVAGYRSMYFVTHQIVDGSILHS